MALEDYIARRHSAGFVAPNYTFKQDMTDDLKVSPSRDTLMSQLSDKVPPYDDSTFKYWCYDTPGLINPHQVHCCYTLLQVFVSLHS